MIVVNTATGVMLARLLGPTGRGQLAAALLWPTLLIAIGSLGLGESVVYFVAQRLGQERAVLASGLVVALCQAALLGGAWLLVAQLVLGHYGKETVAASKYMALSLPLGLMAIVTTGVLLGRLEIRSYNQQRLGQIVLTALGLFAIYLLGVRSLIAIVAIYLVAGALTLAYSFAILAGRRWISLRLRLAVVWKLLTFGVRSHLGVVSNIANQNSDQALISIALSPFYLGLYSIALTLPGGVTVIGASVATIALPTVTGAGSIENMRRMLVRLVKLTLALSVLAAVALVIATPAVIRIFFGPEFLAATQVAQVLTLASILANLNRVSSAGLRAFNRPLQAGTGDLIAAVVTVTSMLVLVPRNGLLGAAVAVSVASAVNFGFNAWTCTRLGISVRTLLIPTTADFRALGAFLRRGNLIR
jgi:O-antigen/teichoic acid export membrane protein